MSNLGLNRGFSLPLLNRNAEQGESPRRFGLLRRPIRRQLKSEPPAIAEKDLMQATDFKSSLAQNTQNAGSQASVQGKVMASVGSAEVQGYGNGNNNTQLASHSTQMQHSSGVWHHSYDEAVRESLLTNKPVMAVFSGSDWCHWCVKLKQEVFDAPGFTEWAKRNVVLLELDFPRLSTSPMEIRQQNERLKQKYAVRGFPTVLFLEDDGSEFAKAGYVAGGLQAWILKVETMLNAANRN